MQQQQQGGGGGGGGGSQYRVPSSSSSEMAAAPFAAPTTTAPRTQMIAGAATTTTDTGQQQHQQQQVVEEASPISSRPPAGNFDELMTVTGDEDLLGSAGDETDHRGGISGGNRWPRQETLALLKIRSDMDIAFRDATLKGPLWDEVSRKLGELGYTRSNKKCKEKFENVQKYYKRTKEGRAGRQDGKSYRFFSQLEALHGTASTSNISSLSPAPLPPPPASVTTTTRTSSAKAAPMISIGIGSSEPPQPMPVSSLRIPSMLPTPSQVFPPDLSVSMAPATITPPAAAAGTAIGISFSSSTSSSSASESDEDGDELEAEPSNPSSSRGRKRKRGSAKGGGRSSINNRMMEFFERLMRKVMQKQEVMQQRFLDTIEKREHDRMIREEAWKRQEMSRLNREHELLAQDRTISASRDAAIIAFLQKITGQNIQLPTAAATTVPTAPIPQPATAPSQPPPPPPPPSQQHQQQLQPHQGQRHHQQQSPNSEVIRQQLPVSSEVFMAVPEQQVPPQEASGGGSFEPTSSRWPKVEVLALIKLRSGLEGRYQEAGPKGPLWEDISKGMQQIGYKRSAKRCKEKWENINKYFKKVKESNKSRPEDAKTCPYFHELDALYRKKILGSTSGGLGGDGSSGSSFGNQNMPVPQQQQQQQKQTESMATNSQEQDRSNLVGIMAAPQTTLATDSENNKGEANNGGLPGTLFGQGSSSMKNPGGHKKPEDIVKELIEQQHRQQQLLTGNYDTVEDPDHSDEIDQEEDEAGNDDDDDESEEEMKMDYKIEFQPKQNAGPSNRPGNGTASFMAMVQ